MRTSPPTSSVDIRPEVPADIDQIKAVVTAAFLLADHSAPPLRPGGPPAEVDLLNWLRNDAGWLPGLSLVATHGDQVVGHVVATRAHIGDAAALGLGPLSVHPDHQRTGVGNRLMRDLLLRAETAGETLVALLGDPTYCARFGFVPAQECRIEPPDPAWGDYFQVLPIGTGQHPTGRFAYAEPFDRL
ncbi:N-acetyltransferase [Nocardioides panacisoli]|uniref:GNAT family N-acetyltransferase n=1 Tax=Nocardioides panacisoli TaxID=627624 RepID=UPI001C62B147|nr:N-acetyltransferase [Nocardioides panacisoli]QYJ03113.1 N-acetyltransferase [Nocardioides panacisoli]